MKNISPSRLYHLSKYSLTIFFNSSSLAFSMAFLVPHLSLITLWRSAAFLLNKVLSFFFLSGVMNPFFLAMVMCWWVLLLLWQEKKGPEPPGQPINDPKPLANRGAPFRMDAATGLFDDEIFRWVFVARCLLARPT